MFPVALGSTPPGLSSASGSPLAVASVTTVVTSTRYDETRMHGLVVLAPCLRAAHLAETTPHIHAADWKFSLRRDYSTTHLPTPNRTVVLVLHDILPAPNVLHTSLSFPDTSTNNTRINPSRSPQSYMRLAIHTIPLS
ncbi:hypothetical protein Hypma_007016 [Hypsizygus marmoreus]|uniref:Uncharacterized protein n=1 Tax=Hypsizygus marmoreus TaxID=39966 RepID=A0A369K989_HYPMA|nr:hypothetical protein Hypma_007016 [Hypsizygus marmoreus]